jgi:hypothetical protein
MRRVSHKKLWEDLKKNIRQLFEQNKSLACKEQSYESKTLRLGEIFEDDFILAMMKDMEQEAKGQKPTALAEFIDSFRGYEKEA